eukprot:COSAG01_NODE_3368_length_6183_cov_4.978143_3_plen_81_part_00
MAPFGELVQDPCRPQLPALGTAEQGSGNVVVIGTHCAVPVLKSRVLSYVIPSYWRVGTAEVALVTAPHIVNSVVFLPAEP